MTALPFEFDILESQVDGVPAEVQPAFQYGLALLLVELDRLTDVSVAGADVARFRTPEGSEFELPNPHLSPAQTSMTVEHLRWLLVGRGLI
ncbi:MAG: hypothetical protein FOGNACKC_03391 [Anaerolineae bacterium]|nr:hypothetical protein [Anaerolineae bacterium]